MADIIRMEFIRYRFVCENLSPDYVSVYNEVLSALMQKSPDDSLLHAAIWHLAQLVSRHFGQNVLILIDEYDAPMMSAYESGCYDNLRSFFRNLFSSALKGNMWMDKAILTGVQRIAKEGILSGLSNLDVCTVAHVSYSDCCGFTEQETRELLGICGLGLDERARQMYNGYRFGSSRLYNPWAIVNYARNGKLAGYWTGTAGDDMLVEKLRAASPQFLDSLDRILSTGSAQVRANLEKAVFEDDSDSSTWGLFVNSGYLTFADVPDPERKVFNLCTPNSEVRDALWEIVERYYGTQDYDALEDLFKPLLESRDTVAFARLYTDIVLNSTSCHDKREYSCHMLMLGMCLSLKEYDVTSNREAGHGRYDILLKPKSKRKGRFPVVIDYKHGEEKDLDSLAKGAVEQIKRMGYVAELEGEVMMVGIAHDGKRCSLEFGWTNNPV